MSSPQPTEQHDARNDPDTTIVRADLNPNATALHNGSAFGGSVPLQTSGFVPGSRLNGIFRLEKQLGRGGMGEAWKAYDETADRYVVLKFIPKEVQHIQAAVDSVRDSFRKVHELQHQHICPVYGLFTDPDHGLYLAMKFIDGMPLDEYKQHRIEKSGKMSFSDAVQILWGIAKGLDYAHEKRVVHRDIKPQNVMISKKDGVQIIDFGLAEEIRTSMAKFSEVVMEVSGTRPYMAPEQWQGRMQDARTDQYALAVTAYELFAGHPPFQGNDIGILRECVLNDPPEPIPMLPEHVNAALTKALAKKRDDRFPDCKAFVKALAEKPKAETADAEMPMSVVPSLPSDRTSGATAPPMWVPPVSTMNSSTKKSVPVRRNDNRLLVFGVVAVCAVLLGLGGLFLGKSPSTKVDTAKKTKPVDTEKPEKKVSPPQPPSADLTKLSDDEKNLLQQKYNEIDWKDTNVIVLPKPTKDDLEKALKQASETKANDIVVVRTTKENHRLVLGGDPFTVQHKAVEAGSVTLIALGPERLVLNGDKKGRLFVVKDGAECNFGGIVFTNGQVVDGYGGAVCVNDDSTARFFQCDFVENACLPDKESQWWKGFGGGGLAGTNHSTIILRNVLFEKNRNCDYDDIHEPKKPDVKICYETSAGLLMLRDSSLVATDVVFRDNIGGGMQLIDAKADLRNMLLVGNKVWGNGGGMGFYGMKAVEVRNISLIDNKSRGGGGGMYLEGADSGQTYRIVNLFASGNTCGQFGGGVQIAGKGRFLLEHLTLVGNHGDNGGGLCFGGTPPIAATEVTVSNSIIAGNQGKWVNNFDTNNGNIEKLNVHDCIFTEQLLRRTMLSSEHGNRMLPLEDIKLGELKDFGNGTPVMPLLAGSPAIDAGIVTETTPKTDITGRPRNVGKAPDIGAFEWQSETTQIAVAEKKSQHDIDVEVADLVVNKLRGIVSLKLPDDKSKSYIATRKNTFGSIPGVVAPLPSDFKRIDEINLTPLVVSYVGDSWKMGDYTPFPCKIAGFQHHNAPCACTITPDEVRTLASINDYIHILDLNNRHWTPEDWTQLFKGKSLGYLNISATPPMPDWKSLESLKSIYSLDAKSNLIAAVHMESVAKMPSLRLLILHASELSPGTLKPLEGNDQLEMISLSYCGGLTDVEFQSLAALKALQRIELVQTVMNDRQLLFLADVKKLKKIALKNNGVTKKGLEAFQAKRPDVEVDLKGQTSFPVRSEDIPDSTREVFLGDVLWKSAKTRFDCPGPKAIPWLDGVKPTALWTPAPSNLTYELKGRWKTFESMIGVQTHWATLFPLNYIHMPGGDQPSVKFIVKGDGKVLYESDVLRTGGKKPIFVDVSGVDVLELITDDCGDGARFDASAWFEPTLKRDASATKESPSPVRAPRYATIFEAAQKESVQNVENY